MRIWIPVYLLYSTSTDFDCLLADVINIDDLQRVIIGVDSTCVDPRVTDMSRITHHLLGLPFFEMMPKHFGAGKNVHGGGGWGWAGAFEIVSSV